MSKSIEEKVASALTGFAERYPEYAYGLYRKIARDGTHEHIFTFGLKIYPSERNTERERTIFRNTIKIKDGKVVSENHPYIEDGKVVCKKPIFICNDMTLYIKFLNHLKRIEHLKLRRPDINGRH